MEKVLDYEQDLGGPKEDPTRPMKAPQGPPGTMIRKFNHIYEHVHRFNVFWDPFLTRILNGGDFD